MDSDDKSSNSNSWRVAVTAAAVVAGAAVAVFAARRLWAARTQAKLSFSEQELAREPVAVLSLDELKSRVRELAARESDDDNDNEVPCAHSPEDVDGIRKRAKQLHSDGKKSQAAAALLSCLPYVDSKERFDMLVTAASHLVASADPAVSYSLCLEALKLADVDSLWNEQTISASFGDLFRVMASSVTEMNRFPEVLSYIDKFTNNNPVRSIERAAALLFKGETLGMYADVHFRGKKDFDKLIFEGVDCARQSRLILNTFANQGLDKDIFFYRPEVVMTTLFLLRRDMEQVEHIHEARCNAMVKALPCSHITMARTFEAWADMLLENDAPEKIDKAEKVYDRAVGCAAVIPGTSGALYEMYLRMARAQKVWARQPQNAHRIPEVVQECRELVESFRMQPAAAHIRAMTVQAAFFSYEPLQNDDGTLVAADSTGCSASFTLEVRLRRRVVDFVPRLPEGGRLSFTLMEWDDRSRVLRPVKGIQTTILTHDQLWHRSRNKRVANFVIRGLRPRAVSHLCRVEVHDVNNQLVGAVEQHVVSYVDCATVSLEQAIEVFEEVRAAVQSTFPQSPLDVSEFRGLEDQPA